MRLMQTMCSTMLASVVGVGGVFSQPANTKGGGLGDLSSAKLVEVKDVGSAVVLRGQFDHRAERDGDIDKDARLSGTGAARGEADIDIDGDDRSQELEIEVRGLPANQSFTVWIDGRELATFTTNDRGRADTTWEGLRP